MQAEWQPIETAPSDLKTALVVVPAYALPDDDNEAPHEVRHDIEPAITVAHRDREGMPWECERELDANGDYFGDDWCWGFPTHWMPLPAPPPKAIEEE